MGTHEYFKAYNAVANKHGIGEREMLVLLKAYAQYKDDEGLGKSEDMCGWISGAYDILPRFNCFGEGRIYIPDSFQDAKGFWEQDLDNTHWRLSAEGRKFVEDDINLFDAAVPLLVAVMDVQNA